LSGEEGLCVACGSALLRDVGWSNASDAVVSAVDAGDEVPHRWDPESGMRSRSHAGEAHGVAALTPHGRTRAWFTGAAEYDTIRAVKQAVGIPVIANGDIDTVLKAREVLDYTGADAVMIGRAAQGRPWIFREIAHFLATGEQLPPPGVEEVRELLLAHLDDHYRFYGAEVGVRTARKHIIWYTRQLVDGRAFCDEMNRLDNCSAQKRAVDAFLRLQGEHGERLAYVPVLH
jgi:tRNA-dihydrouridine synthase B